MVLPMRLQAFYNIQNVLFAELHAAIMAIEIAHNKGWKAIWLECVSYLVVDIFNGECFIRWKLLNKWIVFKGWLSIMEFKRL
ncbi:hypothetical protein Lal_00021948 [Lupinus albus]|nr:hypothetical protein Lal_00021948 [Lupinus albus]